MSSLMETVRTVAIATISLRISSLQQLLQAFLVQV
jgi:hypothetical protein